MIAAPSFEETEMAIVSDRRQIGLLDSAARYLAEISKNIYIIFLIYSKRLLINLLKPISVTRDRARDENELHLSLSLSNLARPSTASSASS